MSVLRFGAFILDPARGAVLRDGVEVELRTQSFAVLSHLASNPGRLVSKDELFDAIWRDAEVTPTRSSSASRRSARPSATPITGIIKTVRGKGYRFVAEISPVAPAPQTVPEPDPSLPRDPSPPTVPPQTIWQAPFIALGLLIAVLAGGSSWLLWNYMRPQPPAMLTMMAAALHRSAAVQKAGASGGEGAARGRDRNPAPTRATRVQDRGSIRRHLQGRRRQPEGRRPASSASGTS